VIIIELPKVPDEDDGTAVWPWLKFFKSRKLEEFDMLAKKHPEISGPVVEIKRLSWSERRRMIAEAREKLRRDNAAIMDDAREDGLAEGMAEGEAKNRMETARRMKKDDFSIEQIVKYTGLTAEEIERI
jgi:predicted transposase/invertase (TIGR01784 family)